MIVYTSNTNRYVKSETQLSNFNDTETKNCQKLGNCQSQRSMKICKIKIITFMYSVKVLDLSNAAKLNEHNRSTLD